MKCPKCNAEMQRVGLEQAVGTDIFEEWQCPVCGYRETRKRQKPGLM